MKRGKKEKDHEKKKETGYQCEKREADRCEVLVRVMLLMMMQRAGGSSRFMMNHWILEHLQE